MTTSVRVLAFSGTYHSGRLSETVEIVTMDVVLSFGVLFNLYTTFALTRTPINSLLSKLLLYNQNALDGSYCFVIIVVICSHNFTLFSPPGNPIPFVCYILQSGFLNVFCRTMVVCNIVCQCADRFWAVIYPRSYRIHTKRYIIVCYLGIPLYSACASLSRAFLTVIVDGHCDHHTSSITERVVTTFDTVFRYGIPVILMISLNITVMRKLRRTRLPSDAPPVASIQSTTDLTTDKDQHEKSSANKVLAAQKAILINTVVLMSELSILQVVGITMNVLDALDVIDFSVDSRARLYFMFLLSTFSAINPFLTILSMKSLRLTIIHQWREIITVTRSMIMGCYKRCPTI
ncbi:unnamed protein product [Echinostoma caproni]|uniref:G_PROTEIN_RECEP_F1_2 domain-containing protein n=1 Tax=Echinostoma caproni TaxID=27848 RepID=A0A183AQZ8_9TREM|nr:unnamed protein product [Echinostoma caproni]